MKNNRLTKNLGIKIASLIAAFALWLVVVNIDDPVISRTFSGIPIEILNEDIIADEGMCYEIIGGTDTATVVVSAKRSVLDDMSRDHIKATADFKSLSALNTLPVEVKVTRYADAVDSVTTRTESVQLKLESLVTTKVPLNVEVVGDVEEGYLLSSVKSKFEEVEISGPESLIANVASAECEVDVEGISADESVNVPVKLLDINGRSIDNTKLELKEKNVSVNVVVWGTKEVPVTCTVSGTPADGYSVANTVSVTPESVVITGRSAYLSSMNSILIPSERVSVAGASTSVNETVNLKSLLPDGILFADEDFDGKVVVSVDIEPNEHKTINVPVSNISIENIPEGYKAVIVDVGATIPVEVQGKGDTFDRFDGNLAMGTIDALTLSPRTPAVEGQIIHAGANDGLVKFTLPTGVYEVTPLYLEVIVEQTDE